MASTRGRSWADILSDDDEDEDDFFLSVADAPPVTEDTYQGDMHPDFESSKLGLLASFKHDFDCNSRTPLAKGKRFAEEDTATEPKTKFPRIEEDEPEKKPVYKPLGLLPRTKEVDPQAAPITSPTKVAPIASPAKATSIPSPEKAVTPPSSAVLRPKVTLKPASAEAANDVDWERRREQREKQVQKGKEMPCYLRYKEMSEPAPTDPLTPRCDTRQDKKDFTFDLKVWKTFLHKFDPQDA